MLIGCYLDRLLTAFGRQWNDLLGELSLSLSANTGC